MDTPVSLALRPFEELLGEALRTKREGDVVLREKRGSIHRVTVRSGYVVRVRIAGRFDPILAELRRAGTLSSDCYMKALEGLAASERRSGQLAVDAGVSHEIVARALAGQTRRRLATVLARARSAGRDAWMVSRPVRAEEIDARVALDPLPATRKRRAKKSRPESARTPPVGRAAVAHDPHSPREPRDRRALRKLAFALHPDRHAHLSAEARAALTEDLARITATFHRLDRTS